MNAGSKRMPLIETDLADRVKAMYREADAEVAAAGPICVASGRCCRFKEFGHRLYVSHLEAAVLLEECPSYTTPTSSDFCPFQKDGLCTAREPRPLGCRVYFCDPAYQDRAREISEEYLERLKRLSEEVGCGWKYGPLHLFLDDPEEARVERNVAAGPG